MHSINSRWHSESYKYFDHQCFLLSSFRTSVKWKCLICFAQQTSFLLASKSLSSPDFFQLSCLSRREKSSVCTKLSVLPRSQRLGRREREMCQKSWVVLACFVTSHLECSSQHRAGLWDTLWAASSRRQNHDFLLSRRQRQGKKCEQLMWGQHQCLEFQAFSTHGITHWHSGLPSGPKSSTRAEAKPSKMFPPPHFLGSFRWQQRSEHRERCR